MKRYCIKSRTGKIEFFDVISEDNCGYRIRLTRVSGGSEKVVEESLTRHLFDLCVKTGYIFELESPAEVFAGADRRSAGSPLVSSAGAYMGPDRRSAGSSQAGNTVTVA